MNRDFIQAAKNASKAMLKTSKPLFDYLGVKNFGYLKIFLDDLKFYYNTTDVNLLTEYLDIVKSTCIFVEDAIIEHIHNRTYYFLTWPNKATHFSMELYLKYSFWNGYTILTFENNIIEMWWIAPSANYNYFANFCHKNRHNFVKFIQHFHLRFDHHIPKDTKCLPSFNPIGSNFSLPQGSIIEADDELFKKIINEMPKNTKYNIPLFNNKISFTNKEVECLKLLALGLTKKQISNKFDVSERTIESHYNNLKIKTNIHLKSDLIEIYNKYLKAFY